MSIQPPRWCKNAVASKEGWRHHKTGELLCCKTGLLDLISEEVKEEPVMLEVEEAIIETTTEEQTSLEVSETLAEEPVKVKKSRAKK